MLYLVCVEGGGGLDSVGCVFPGAQLRNQWEVNGQAYINGHHGFY